MTVCNRCTTTTNDIESAQRTRSSYIDTAGAVAKLGILAKDAFSSNTEAIFFAEQMNKQFVIGNASNSRANGRHVSTYPGYTTRQKQVARENEFRSITETAPMLAQAIAQYTGKTMGQLKEMSAEGTITADVIKGAMFAAAGATNAKFASMPKTFAQAWQTAKDRAIRAFEPVLTQINAIVNSNGFQSYG